MGRESEVVCGLSGGREIKPLFTNYFNAVGRSKATETTQQVASILQTGVLPFQLLQHSYFFFPSLALTSHSHYQYTKKYMKRLCLQQSHYMLIVLAI